MGDLVNLEEYKEQLLLKEIAEMKEQLRAIVLSWPEEEGGHYLSLEEMDQIEKIWLEEKRNQ